MVVSVYSKILVMFHKKLKQFRRVTGMLKSYLLKEVVPGAGTLICRTKLSEQEEATWEVGKGQLRLADWHAHK